MAAKKKKPAKKKSARRVFQDCGGRGCAIDRRAVRVSSVATFPGFNYTTPNAINASSPIKPLTRTQRKKPPLNCAFTMKEYIVKTGKDAGKTKWKEVVSDPRAECQDPQKPCDTDRNTCPVQLFFRRGEAFLRFCHTKGKPGVIKRVANAKEAQRLASKACQCWEANNKSFAKCKHIIGSQLGEVRYRRRR